MGKQENLQSSMLVLESAEMEELEPLSETELIEHFNSVWTRQFFLLTPKFSHQEWQLAQISQIALRFFQIRTLVSKTIVTIRGNRSRHRHNRNPANCSNLFRNQLPKIWQDVRAVSENRVMAAPFCKMFENLECVRSLATRLSPKSGKPLI